MKGTETARNAGLGPSLFGNYSIDKLENIGNIVKLREGSGRQKY